MNDIQLQIMEKLCQIEVQREVKIPFAIESGSRAWGFASPDSDYDCRFVYVQPQSKYLSIFSEKDTIDFIPDAIFDLSGWDLRKFIQLLSKSNAVTLEWLRSNEIYRRNDAVADMLWQLGQTCFHPVATAWHYLNMAKKKLEEIEAQDTAKIKTYFYLMRPLACVRFIHEHQDIPFMEYRRNLASINVPEDIRRALDALLLQKETAQEAAPLAKNHSLLTYFKQEIEQAQHWLETAPHEKKINHEKANQCFREIIRMVNADD